MRAETMTSFRASLIPDVILRLVSQAADSVLYSPRCNSLMNTATSSSSASGFNLLVNLKRQTELRNEELHLRVVV